MAKPTKHGKRWRIRWLDENGVRRSKVFDTYKEAEFQLNKKQAEVVEVRRGLRSPEPVPCSFPQLAQYYLQYRTSLKRYQRGDQLNIKNHLLPFFKDIPLGRVEAHIDRYKLEKSNLSPKTVHNHLTLLISMLHVAHCQKWIREVPRIRKPRVRVLDKDFRYLHTQDEIDRFLEAAEIIEPTTLFLYATAVYTGMRAGEIAGLRWDDVDFSSRLITIQRSYAGLTKNGEIRHVPILDPLLPVLRSWRLNRIGSLVFPNSAGNMHQDSARVFQEILHEVLKLGGFPEIIYKGKKRRYITFHGLRHTFASHWVMRGGNMFKLQKILGHSSFDMTMRYSHLAPHAFQEDYSLFGDAKSTKGKVIKFPGEKK